MPAPAPPPVKPTSVIRASPGPFTTQPMIDRVIGVRTCSSLRSSSSTVAITSKPWRAQVGHEITLTPRWRSPRDLRISCPARTSSTGSAERLTRSVSPIPAHSRAPRPIADLTVPVRSPPASVTPRWIGASVASARRLQASAVMKTSLAFTDTLNASNPLSRSSRM